MEKGDDILDLINNPDEAILVQIAADDELVAAAKLALDGKWPAHPEVFRPSELTRIAYHALPYVVAAVLEAQKTRAAKLKCRTCKGTGVLIVRRPAAVIKGGMTARHLANATDSLNPGEELQWAHGPEKCPDCGGTGKARPE